MHRIWTLPTQIAVQALLFLCILSLRDAMKQTFLLLPIPTHSIAWVWAMATFQIGVALLILLLLTWCNWIDPEKFITH